MRFLVLSFFVILLILNSCSSHQKVTKVPPNGPYHLSKAPLPPVPDQYVAPILAIDKRVTKVLLYVNHSQQKYPSGQVRILMNLYNANTAQDEWVDWKVLFYDENNNKIEETEWASTLFPRQIIKTIEARSLRPDVKNFTVIVKTSPRTDPTKTKPLGLVRELEERQTRQKEEAATKQSITQIGISNTANPHLQVSNPVQQINNSAQTLQGLTNSLTDFMRIIQMMNE